MVTADQPAISVQPANLTDADLLAFRRKNLLVCAGCRAVVAERWLLAGQPAIRIKLKVRSTDERVYIVPAIARYDCGKCGFVGELVLAGMGTQL